ncbi:28211_t:CDS:2 [Dentiscutata erythropus]|uniref:28211_t:CDS:1 n=1 Tax=Dentiscutata erythropus TaxID=1348616 RepID=A0A9N9D0B5_9GLOM|nr:28211_t:CDS:2 [Dentiscutata erythropus]
MDEFLNRINYYNVQLDKELSKYPHMRKLEQYTSVPKTYLAVGVAAFLFLMIFFNILGELLSDIIGWLYPAYVSFKAIENKNYANDAQLLTYW